MDDAPRPDFARRLRTLLADAEVRSHRDDVGGRHAIFISATREWTIHYRLDANWFNLRTHLCALPADATIKRRLLEHAMTANAMLALVKFATTPTTLTLDCEYRAEHVRTEVVQNLTGLFLATLDEQYPKIFRLVQGDDVLAKLDYTRHDEAA